MPTDVECCDGCPFLREQEERLAAARILSNAKIGCLVWGWDALSFIHAVPTWLFDLGLVVADQDIERASEEITRSLPYEIFTGINDKYADPISLDPHRTRMYTLSTYLQLTKNEPLGEQPKMIFIHPESQFGLDVSDYSRSVPFPPFPDSIRFPTRTALLDSLLETYLDPPSGRLTSRLSLNLADFISGIIGYTFRKEPVLPDGNLEAEHAQVMRTLKPENQPVFEGEIRNTFRDHLEKQLLRKEVLKRLGKFEQAERPLPRGPPGNPAFVASIMAKYTASQPLKHASPITLSSSKPTAPVSLGSKRRPFSMLRLRGPQTIVRQLVRFIR